MSIFPRMCAQPPAHSTPRHSCSTTTAAISFSVATLDGAGRSATAQLLHASEAAFWPDLEAQVGFAVSDCA